MPTLNISLIGMQAVGKTSIIKKYVYPNKEISKKSAISTIGVD